MSEQGGGGEAAAAVSSPWGGLSEDHRGYVEMKGWKDHGALVDSYRNLEKLRGVPAERLLTLPGKEDDAEGWEALYGRLGRPEKPEGYELEGADPELLAELHKLGMSKRHLHGAFGLLKARSEAATKASEEKWQADATAADEALKREWGGEFDTNIRMAGQMAQRVQKMLGQSDEQWKETADKLQRAVGVELAVKMFAGLGRGLGEGKFVEGESQRDGFGMTPARARAELQQLRTDPDHIKRKQSDNKAVRMAAVAREMELDQVAFPESAA